MKNRLLTINLFEVWLYESDTTTARDALNLHLLDMALLPPFLARYRECRAGSAGNTNLRDCFGCKFDRTDPLCIDYCYYNYNYNYN
jgi:hypothetical protein